MQSSVLKCPHQHQVKACHVPSTREAEGKKDLLKQELQREEEESEVRVAQQLEDGEEEQQSEGTVQVLVQEAEYREEEPEEE